MTRILSTAVFCCSVVASLAGFRGSLSGYACNQQQLYQQCQCTSFCSPYQGGYPSYNGENGQYPTYMRHRRPHRKHHHKKKFHLETFDSDSEELEEPATTTHAPRSTTNSWEDEDLWEKKFVGEHGATETDDFPEIDSAEIERARENQKAREREHLQKYQPQSAGNSAGGVGGGVGGGGSGAGGIGVHTGLGIGAPGVGGMGGSGGIFGISSGVGIGVPGVGPIGISSGLGIGK